MLSSSSYATEMVSISSGNSADVSDIKLKASTTSSSSSYATEMVSISSGNSADVSDTNEGYAAINDTALQRKRRLPMPPALKPPRPKKNFTSCLQPCKELCSYCCGSRLILSMTVLGLTLASLGVLIYLLMTYKSVVPDPVPPITPPPDPCDADAVPAGSNYTLKFDMTPVQKPEVLNLLQESIRQNATILQNVKLNFTKRTWSFDGREISIEISVIDKEDFHIVIDLKISNSQCRHAGKYFVLLSGNNHKSEQSLLYKVKDECPCESEYEVNFAKELKCDLKVIGNTTITFNKVSGENITPIVYQTGINIPDNVPERGRFSAMWNRSGTLTTRIKFSPVRCQDEGNYSLTVTSRKGTQLHYMYVKVIDHSYEPSISTLRGLIKGKDNVLQCQASTGCKDASLTLQTTEGKGNYYIPSAENLTSIHFQEGDIWKTNATLNLTPYMVDSRRDRCFKCTYSIGDKRYYSKPICIQIIPDDFCETRNLNCLYPHPYDCNKFITCVTSGPVESFCQAGLHYHQSVNNCTGQCDYPKEVNCKIRQFDGCDCQDS